MLLEKCEMNSPSELTGTIERTLRALQCVAENGEFSAKEVAREVGIPTSTAYRLLQTLSAANFVEKSNHGNYRIGREYIRLASLVVSTCDYEAIADPFVNELVDKFEETCALALYLPKQHAFTIVHMRVTNHALQYVIEKYMPRPMITGALGRAMLPFLPKEDVLAAIENQECPPEQGAAKIDWDTLQSEFETIHRQGCYIGTSPSALGTNATAAAVFNSKGQILGSIGVTVPSVRYDPERQPEISAAVIDAARRLSATLGFDERSKRLDRSAGI